MSSYRKTANRITQLKQELLAVEEPWIKGMPIGTKIQPFGKARQEKDPSKIPNKDIMAMIPTTRTRLIMFRL